MLPFAARKSAHLGEKPRFVDTLYRLTKVGETKLAQHEAEALLSMEKHRVDERVFTFSSHGQKEEIELLSADKHERFFLDLSRGRVEIRRVKMQNRARNTVILARLDLNDRTHTNPDNQEIATPHLHLYREGFGDRWAYPVPSDKFTNLDDTWTTLHDFMRYCNITKPPNIKRDLFT